MIYDDALPINTCPGVAYEAIDLHVPCGALINADSMYCEHCSVKIEKLAERLDDEQT